MILRGRLIRESAYKRVHTVISIGQTSVITLVFLKHFDYSQNTCPICSARKCNIFVYPQVAGCLRIIRMYLYLDTLKLPASTQKCVTYVTSCHKALILLVLQIKANSMCFCVIDDCLDADIPLAELSLAGVHFLHKIHPHGQGNATFKLTGEYYNRALSGWEPFLEQWG